jgi:hypothetical protein
MPKKSKKNSNVQAVLNDLISIFTINFPSWADVPAEEGAAFIYLNDLEAVHPPTETKAVMLTPIP